MDFINKPMKWDNAGVQPSAELSAKGYVAKDKPAADTFNYFLHNNAECIEELQEKTFGLSGVYTDDMNDLVIAGQYRVQSNANLPTDAYYGQAFVGRSVVEGGNNDTVAQLVISYTKGRMFHRGGQLKDGTWIWEDWSTVFSTSHKPNFNNVSWLGFNPVSATGDDTVEKWCSLGSGFAQYNNLTQLTDQPSRYGFLMNYTYGSDVFQLWTTLPSGALYSRSGNTMGWGRTWTKIYDAGNIPTANELGVESLSGGTQLPDNADLNTYKTQGNYHCLGDATAQTLKNCPVTNAFRMKVGHPTGGGSYIYQELYNWNKGTRYYRQCLASSNSWTDWIETFDGSRTVPVANGGTGANNANGAVRNLLVNTLIGNESIKNANTLTKTGIHKVYVTDEALAKNNNFPYVYGNLVVISNMEETNYAYVMQMFLTTNGDIFVRASTNSGSNWTEWDKKFSAKGGNITGTVMYLGDGFGRFIANENQLQIEAWNTKGDDSNRRLFTVSNSKYKGNKAEALLFTDRVDSVNYTYKIYGEHNKPTASDVGLGLVDITSDFFESKEGFGWIGQVYKQGNIIQGSLMGNGVPNKKLFKIKSAYRPATSAILGIGYVATSNSEEKITTAISDLNCDVFEGSNLDGVIQLSFTYICK